MLEKTLESPLGYKEMKPDNPEGNQPWIFTGRTDAKAEAPILWPPDAKSSLIGKAPEAGKDWRQEEKGTAEDEMVGWHHQFNGHEFEHAPGNDDGQGGLECCSAWRHRVGLYWATEMPWTALNIFTIYDILPSFLMIWVIIVIISFQPRSPSKCLVVQVNW